MYAAPDVLGRSGFDLVYTGIGALCWLPDIKRWAQTVAAVLDAGLTLTGFVEHQTVAWQGLPGKMRLVDGNEWQLSDRPERLPHTYTLQAVRNPV